jgi:hypothetical protein
MTSPRFRAAGDLSRLVAGAEGTRGGRNPAVSLSNGLPRGLGGCWVVIVNGASGWGLRVTWRSAELELRDASLAPVSHARPDPTMEQADMLAADNRSAGCGFSHDERRHARVRLSVTVVPIRRIPAADAHHVRAWETAPSERARASPPRSRHSCYRGTDDASGNGPSCERRTSSSSTARWRGPSSVATRSGR